MRYDYSPEKLDELLTAMNDDDSVTITGRELRKLAEVIRKRGRGRKPIVLDEDLFDSVVRRWQSGEITARSAMRELDLKPNTFYRRVKERYENMDDLRSELKKAAKALKDEHEDIKDLKDLKELGQQIKEDAGEIGKLAMDKVESTVGATKMETEILKEKLAAEIDHKKDLAELKKAVEAEAEALKASK